MSAGKDYYKVLGVPRDGSFQDIAKSFRVLAITHHPLKNPATMAQSNYKFCQICEAFEVLSTRMFFLSVITFNLASLREAYDRYGEETLKNGYLSKCS